MINKYRIVVVVDGGGIRGVIPLKILSRIEELAREFDPDIKLSSLVDLFSAASTGSILVGALMIQNKKGRAVHSPTQLLNFYLDNGHRIFRKRKAGEQYDGTSPFAKVLEIFFSSTSLGDIKKHFLLVSHDVNSDAQFLFTDASERYRHVSLDKIMRGCSAMADFLAPLSLGELLLMDGMNGVKNPSILAYNYAKKIYPGDPIVVISLGTGKTSPTIIERKEKDTSMDVDNEMRKIAKKDSNLIYLRFQPTILRPSNELSFNTHENALQLIEETDRYLEKNKEQFKQLVGLLKIKTGYTSF
jgi:uncharacterized protein